MKVLLLQPPIQDFYDTDVRLPPIGLGYLKAAILRYLPGVSVTVKDYHQGWGRRTIALPAELKFLESYYVAADKSPFAVFHQYYHYGAAFDDLAREVAAEKPDVIGISSLFSPYYREVLETARTIKAKLDVPIVVGGSHATALPETMLGSTNIDFVIRGEGERPMVELLKALRDGEKLDGVPNLAYRERHSNRLNRLEENFPLDEIPEPDFSDFPPDRYQFEGRPMAVVLTSRGCPYHCDFCSVHSTFAGPYRRRANQDILREIRQRYECGIRVFDFEDDNLTYDRTAAAELFRQLAEEYGARDVQFLAMNGVSYWDLDDSMITSMKAADFTHLNLSLVSVNENVLRNHQRPFDLEKHRHAAQKAFDLGLKVVSYQILGLPGESLQSVLEGLIHTAHLPVLVGASPFYLPPGSPLYESSQNRVSPFVGSRLTALGHSSASLTTGLIYTLLITSRIIDFLKGLPLSSDAVTLSEALAVASAGDNRMHLGAELLDRLLQSGDLYAGTSKGTVKLSAFQSDVFCEVWRKLGFIVTQEGRTIRVA